MAAAHQMFDSKKLAARPTGGLAPVVYGSSPTLYWHVVQEGSAPLLNHCGYWLLRPLSHETPCFGTTVLLESSRFIFHVREVLRLVSLSKRRRAAMGHHVSCFESGSYEKRPGARCHAIRRASVLRPVRQCVLVCILWWSGMIAGSASWNLDPSKTCGRRAGKFLRRRVATRT